MISTLHLGPVALPTYPLLALLGFYLGLWLAAQIAARRGINPDHLYNLGFYAAIAAAIAGRIGHILLFFPAYRSDPLSILSPNLAAFQPVFAVAAVAIVILFYQRRYHLPVAELGDALAYGALLTLATLALADGLNGKHFGIASTQPWAIQQWGMARHPVQYYEMLGTLLLIALLWWRQQALRPGQLGLWAAAGYAAVRLFVDAYRDQPVLIGDGYRQSQVIAFMALLILLLAVYQTLSTIEPPSGVTFEWQQGEDESR